MAQNTQIDQDALAAEWGMALEAESGGAPPPVAAAPAVPDAGQWAAMPDDANLQANKGGAERILNQDEIDSLLGFSLADVTLNDNSGIRAIIDSAMVSYERLPMLEIVFDRLVRLMTTSLRNFTSDNVEVSLDRITSVRFGDYLNSIPLPAILSVFKAEEIDWIEADEYYAKLHIGGRVHMVRQTMHALEEQLPAAQFVRIHRSTIVNLDRIVALEPMFQGDYTVILTDGTRLRMSRRRRDVIAHKLKHFA